MITTITTLTCDDRGTQPWHRCSSRAEQPGGMSRDLMRMFAREKGWIMIKGKDYCAEHAPLHPTHGTVREEMAANGYITCPNTECAKAHIPLRGTFTCDCGTEIMVWEHCRSERG